MKQKLKKMGRRTTDQGRPEVLTGQDATVVVVEQMKALQLPLQFLHFHYCWQNDQIALLLNVTALVQGLPQLGGMSAKTGGIHPHDFHHCYCFQTFCWISSNFEMMKKGIAVAEVGEVHSFLQKLMQNL